MASASSQRRSRDDVTSTRHEKRHLNDLNNPHDVKVGGEGHGMTFIKKVMLCGQFVGTEAVMSFIQIYNMPALQTLGMPLSLSSIACLVSGPSSVLFLPLLGWLIDKERNSQRRKFAALVLAATLLIVGLMCLLSANTIHLLYLMKYNATNHLDIISDGALNSSGCSNLTAHDKAEGSEDGSTTVPFKAGLALFGFILMDMGLDYSTAFTKAFTVTCSPRTEQTSLILMAVILGAVGGVANSVLGVVDFTSLLGLNFVEGAKLTIQSSIQGVILIVIVITGLLFTSCTGWTQLRDRDLQEDSTRTTSTTFCHSKNGTNSTKCHEHSATSFHKESDLKPDNPQNGRSLMEAFENSVRSFGGSSMYWDSSWTLHEDGPPPLAEDVPLLQEDTRHAEKKRENQMMTGHGAAESATPRLEGSSSVKTHTEVEAQQPSEMPRQGSLSSLNNPKVRILFVFIATMFSAGAVTMFTYAISDFVGKAVYGGDPEAPPGSDSLTSYQEGMGMTSWALLVYYTTYLAFSIANPTILAFLGFRLEFLLLQLLYSAFLLVTGLTSRLEVLFAVSVVAGMHRTCFYSMPYVVTNSIAQTITYTGSGRNPVSLALSLVAAALPLGYCLLFSWVGAVEELTGDVAVPLWLGTADGIISVIAFLFIGKV